MTSDRGAQIIEKAKEMGAAIAGIASVELLKKSPSHEILGKFGTKINGVHAFEGMIEGFNEIKWPAKVKSALVIAFSHPKDKPELDWTYASGNTPGNRILQRINRELAAWIGEALGIKTHRMPYWVEKGGIYLKDTAVLGGLGCIGRNNMLITPELGPSAWLGLIIGVLPHRVRRGSGHIGDVSAQPLRVHHLAQRSCAWRESSELPWD